MKKNIIAFIVIAIVFTGVGVFATTAITADQINYDENTTVKDKIDDLYDAQTNQITTLTEQNSSLQTELNKYKNSITIKLLHDSNSTISGVSMLDFYAGFKGRYKYFKIKSIVADSSTSTSGVTGWSETQRTEIALTLNQQYNVVDTTDGYEFAGIILRSNSKANNTWARTYVMVEFYN